MSDPKIGPTFAAELAAAGVGGLNVGWNATTGELMIPDDVSDADAAKIRAVLSAHVPNPPPVTIIPVLDLYRRMTDDEYARMQAGVATQSPRVQGIFARADTFRSDAPEWPLLNAMAVKLYGEARAAELLTP